MGGGRERRERRESGAGMNEMEKKLGGRWKRTKKGGRLIMWVGWWEVGGD